MKNLHFNSSNKNKILYEHPKPVLNIQVNKKRKEYKAGLVALLDSGADDTMIKLKCLPSNARLERNETQYKVAGSIFETKHIAKVQFTLPQFSTSKIITWKCAIDESDSPDSGIGYDMIIGRDLLNELGIDLSFKTKTISWDEMVVPMATHYSYDKTEKKDLSYKEIRQLVVQTEEPRVTKDATQRLHKIMESNYEKANLEEVVRDADNLGDEQKHELLKLLKEFEELFDGTLGTWNTEPVHIELKADAKPINSRYYPVPHINKQTFKNELKRLVEIGVLEPVSETQWGSPVFIIPKKEGTVRFITDYRKLNQMIVRKPYPLPRIGETMQQLEGFQFASAIDLNMGYYTIELSPDTKDITTIVTEFGKFRYNKLPMGMIASSDIFQAKINELLGDIEGVKSYLDDVLILNKGSFKDHIEQLRECFRRIQNAGLKVNAKKCSFGLQEIPYLGYVISRDGIKPDPKKVQGILDIERPQTVTEVKSLIGMVQYYRDMWQRRSHILTPLTEISRGKKRQKITWTDELEKAFIELKRMVAQETLLHYPDWTIPFDIHTDASDKQLGAVISQKGNPIAFFSRRLNKSQRNYTTTEKELLSIVECLKQFRGILQGYEINVFSDHKNLVYAATVSQSQRVMRWRLILEEFGPNIQHIAGVDNVVADALSRLPSANTDERDPVLEGRHQANGDMFAITREEETGSFPLALSLVREEQLKEAKDKKSNLTAEIKNLEYINRPCQVLNYF